MNPINNPYSPGADAPPPELVGRDPILNQAKILLGRIKHRRPEKSLLFTGLRGVGKTVLLNEIQREAEKEEYQTIFLEAHENKPFGALIAPHLKTLLFRIDRMAGIGNKAKRALSVLSSFVTSLKLSYGQFTLSLDIEREVGSADSGDIEIDLPELFVAVGEAAIDKNTQVAIFIDEIQYLSKEELGALIMSMHKLQQRQLPVLLLGAGLPVLPGLAGESKSYAERLFNFPIVGALSKEDAFRALQEPALKASAEFEEAALEKIYDLTKGYPYFLQEWGYKSWNLAETSPITRHVVTQATKDVIQQLDNNFFRVRFDRLTPKERDFLRMMASFGKGPYKIADIAGKSNSKPSSLSPVRASLIKKGMIYSPSYGFIDFTVPLFNEFMVRVMPEF